MAKLIIELDKGIGYFEGEPDNQFTLTNNVRSLANGKRKRTEVVYSMPANKPYDVQRFPCGTWKITGIEKSNDPTYAPYKIRTNAHQRVRVWALDADGDYDHETTEETDDTEYLLHYSVSATTWGCVRLGSPAIARELANRLRIGDALVVV
jgi:hypothetical protein